MGISIIRMEHKVNTLSFKTIIHVNMGFFVLKHLQ